MEEAQTPVASAETETPAEENRYTRSADILDPEKLQTTHALVIGVGAIGRQVALQLAAMGAGEISICDFDTVDEVNLGPQGFMADEVGQQKVAAVGATLMRSNPDLTLHEIDGRFRRSMDIPPVVFCCVDDIQLRGLIFDGVKDKTEFFCDARMTAESLQVYAVTDDRAKEYYPTTIFASDEAFQGSCTAKSTIFCSNIAAGIMLEQFARFLRGFPTDNKVQINLLAMEMDVE